MSLSALDLKFFNALFVALIRQKFALAPNFA